MPSKSEPQMLAHNYECTLRPTGEDIYILTGTLHRHQYLSYSPLLPLLGALLLNSFVFQFYYDPRKSRSPCKKAMERREERLFTRQV